MNLKLTTIVLFVFSVTFSQSEISYEKTVIEIRNSEKILCTNLLLPDNDFSIGIYTKDWEVEDLTREQCGDIKTDAISNSKIIEVLEIRNLLNTLYVQMENDVYESINSSDTFNYSRAKLIIQLDFSHNWKGLNRVYIPIGNKKEAKELIKSISKIFKSGYCFRKLRVNL